MKYVGIDSAYRRAAWCALGEGGAVNREGVVAADEDGRQAVLELGSGVRARVEMMSGAVSVRDGLAAVGSGSRSRMRARCVTSRRWPANRQGRRARLGRAVPARSGAGALGAEAAERALREQLRPRMHGIRLMATRSAMGTYAVATHTGRTVASRAMR